METICEVAIAIVAIVILRWGWKLLNWVWLKQKKLEKWLRDEGYKGNSYKFVMDDMIEFATMQKEGALKAIPFTHDITSYSLPFDHRIISKYGGKSFIWLGPKPRMYITDPKLIKEILLRKDESQKSLTDPFRFEIASCTDLFLPRVKNGLNIVKSSVPLLVFKISRFIPTRTNKRFKENVKELRLVLKAIIDKRNKAIEMGEGKQDDLFRILLESNKRETEEHGVGMSMEGVIEECKLFYIGGSETTLNVIAWTLVCVSMHQEWQIRAREEIIKVFGDKELEFEGVKDLKVLTMILIKVLRLYPPVVMMTRETHKNTKLGNMMIPSGVQVALVILHVHHDPEIWEDDVNEFKPERFEEGIVSATKGKGSGPFFPFSNGPRVCIGQSFAMMEAKTAVAMALQRFLFELSPFYKHAPFPWFAMPPQFGAPLMLRAIHAY